MTDDGWVFEDIDPFIGDLLRALPKCAEADSDSVRSRIFPAPTGGSDPAEDQDWREHVEPGLRELFQSHLDVVAADLATMRDEGQTWRLNVSAAHGPAWLHTLNQARLALGALHGVTEDDTSGRRRKRPTSEKAFALMQIDFYGMIQSLLLAQTEL